MAQVKHLAIKTMIIRVRDGEDVINSLKFLASSTISQDIATQMDLEKILSPLSKSPHLSGYIHEILKKLDGLKNKKPEQKSAPKRKSSMKRVSKVGGSKKRRSSGVTKKILVEAEDVTGLSGDVKENKKASGGLFKKTETKKKDSSIWKKIKKTQ